MCVATSRYEMAPKRRMTTSTNNLQLILCMQRLLTELKETFIRPFIKCTCGTAYLPGSSVSVHEPNSQHVAVCSAQSTDLDISITHNNNPCMHIKKNTQSIIHTQFTYPQQLLKKFSKHADSRQAPKNNNKFQATHCPLSHKGNKTVLPVLVIT